MQLASTLNIAANKAREIESAMDSVFFCARVVREPGEQCALDEPARQRQLLEAIERLGKVAR